MKRPDSFRIASQLTPEQVQAWSRLQREDPAVDSPFFRPEFTQAVAAIRAGGAAITFVGLGCPRQEVCAYELRQALSMPVLAVGAAFNFHAGLLAQAPGWLQARGLAWSFRLLKEPRRLWERYLLLNPLYVTLLLLQAARVWSFDSQRAGRDAVPSEAIRYG